MRTSNLPVTAILAQCQDLGVTLAPGKQGALRVSPPGVLSKDLKAALIAHKAEIFVLLADNQTRRWPVESNERSADIIEPSISAIKVWSDVLEDTVWVVADDLPKAEWPTDTPVYTHTEVKILKEVGQDTLAWVLATKQMFGAEVVSGGRRSEPAKGRAQDKTGKHLGGAKKGRLR